MKKAGIVTFHNALSYGAALQSYALQQFVKANGIENDIIDYDCNYINKRYKKIISINKNNIPKSFIGSMLKAGNKRKSLKLSKEFRQKFMQLSPQCTKQSVSDLAPDYSVFISGSDQVWSPTCAGFDTTYLLDFAKSGQKYSYAASFGTKEIPNDKKNDYKALLSDFSGLSVRETSGCSMVKNITGCDGQVNIDPTLLLTQNEWDKIASQPDNIKQPYIFLFNVLKPIRLINYAIKLGKEKNMPVYYLNDMHIPKIDGVTYLNPSSPDQFVGLIKNAEYVVTNSFHGNAFSLIYHKKFVMEFETCSKRNNRSEELLKKLGINEREITKDATPDPDAEIDWDKVETVLADERNKSKEYILNIKSEIQSKQ